MDGGTRHTAVAARPKAHGKSRGCVRTHGEVRVAEGLAAQGAKRDGLVALGNRERLWDISRRVVVAIAGLRGGYRAGAYRVVMGPRNRHTAAAPRSDCDRPSGRCSCSHPAIRVARLPRAHCTKTDGL